MGGAYNNFRRPVEYIVDQKLKRQSTSIITENTVDPPNPPKNLVEYPIEFIRDGMTKKVIKILYGLAAEQWSEEFIRNAQGKVYKIKTTLPDGTSTTVEIKKGADGKVNKIE